MLRFATALAAAALTSGLAFAQTAPATRTAAVSPAVASQPAPTVAAVPKTRDGKPKSRELRAACKAEAKGLKDKDGRDAWIACYRAGRPDLAKRFDCRTDARVKGLAGDALKAAVKSCATG